MHVRWKVWFLALAAGVLVGTVLPAGCSSAPTCTQCGRMECRNLAFTVELEGGTKVETCCPRCALHFLETEPRRAVAMTARDFDTGDRLQASAAIYVEGSDVHPCTAGEAPPVRGEGGCCAHPVFDRCLPSLLAFASRESAAAFVREHGGEVRTLADLRGRRP